MERLPYPQVSSNFLLNIQFGRGEEDGYIPLREAFLNKEYYLLSLWCRIEIEKPTPDDLKIDIQTETYEFYADWTYPYGTFLVFSNLLENVIITY